MNTLKSLVVFAVLGVIGYAVYLGLGGQLNVSVSMPSDSSQAGGGQWKPEGPPPPLDSLALHHDTEEHDHDGQAGHDDHAEHKSPTASPSPISTADSPSSTAISSTAPAAYAPPAAASTASRPSPSVPSSGAAASDSAASDSTAFAATTTPPPAAYGAPNASKTSIADPQVVAASSTGPAAYQKTATSLSHSQPQTKASGGALGPQDSVSLLGVQAPGSSHVFESSMKDARQKIEDGHPEDALFDLSMLYEDKQLSAEQRAQLLTLLDQIAGTVIYSREHLMERAYEVKPNERLAGIANALKITPGLLAKINGISETATLAPGTKLKVIRGPFNAVINPQTNELTLFVQSRYAGRFPIHVGPDFSLAGGTGSVVGKTRQHSQFGGHAWIGLSSSPGGSTPPGGPAVAVQEFGIVGMSSPAAVSSGPLRKNIGVAPAHADDLYDILSQGSTITLAR